MQVNASATDCWVVLKSNHSDSDSLGQHVSYGLLINTVDRESHSLPYTQINKQNR